MKALSAETQYMINIKNEWKISLLSNLEFKKVCTSLYCTTSVIALFKHVVDKKYVLNILAPFIDPLNFIKTEKGLES